MSSTPNTVCAWCEKDFWRKPSSPPSKSGLYFCSRGHKDEAFKSSDFPSLHSGPPKINLPKPSRSCRVCGKFSGRKATCSEECLLALRNAATKKCIYCLQEKSVSEFSKSITVDGRTNSCKECVTRNWKSWYSKEPEEKRRANNDANARRYALKIGDSSISAATARRYGASPEEITELLQSSKGMCQICKVSTATHIDHDHNTGAVRGILCNTCNTGLGMFRDSCENLNEAVRYLKASNSSR